MAKLNETQTKVIHPPMLSHLLCEEEQKGSQGLKYPEGIPIHHKACSQLFVQLTHLAGGIFIVKSAFQKTLVSNDHLS